MTTIFLIDDHVLVIEGIKSIMQNIPEIHSTLR